MIFDKWVSITGQTLANEYMNAKLSTGTYGGMSAPFLEKAFDAFSHKLEVQYKAYAVYDGEKVEDTTKLLQICNGV